MKGLRLAKTKSGELGLSRGAATKNRGFVRPRIVFLVVVFALILGGAVTASFAVTKDQSPYAAIEQLGRVLVLVENNHVDPVDREKLLQGAIKGMVAELDPHSSYLPPEDYAAFRSETEGEFGGIGVEVDVRQETITVIAPIEGSPAARAGIRSGDRIIGVDGKPTRGQPIDRIIRSMRGAKGTKVQISVQRPGVDSPIEFTLTREQVHVSSVVSRRLDGDIAYLRVKQFQQGTHDEFLRAIGKIRKEGSGIIAGVVVDLRTNPGGLVDQAAAVADDLLDQGTIYTTRHRGKIVEEATAHAGGALSKGPLVVLVNEYSASASELVAGAIQDHHRGVIVGAITFGKGSVQSIMDLPGGAGLKLTTMLYFTPSGRSIQAEGIHPDVIVSSTVSSSGAPRVVRERDIEGHLPNGGGVTTDAGARLTLDSGLEDGGTPAIELPSNDIPTNPVNGKDLVLSIGYQIVRGVLTVPASSEVASPRPE